MCPALAKYILNTDEQRNILTDAEKGQNTRVVHVCYSDIKDETCMKEYFMNDTCSIRMECYNKIT